MIYKLQKKLMKIYKVMTNKITKYPTWNYSNPLVIFIINKVTQLVVIYLNLKKNKQEHRRMLYLLFKIVKIKVK